MNGTREHNVGAEPVPTSDIPLVSVIVATNRSSPFLAEALQSVVDQTHPRVELIVVDDGAEDPDFVQRAVAGISGALVLREPASGVAVARNKGASHATGAFLAFLDDDDRWHPDRVEHQLQAFARAPHAVVGYCGMQSIDQAGQVVAAADQTAVDGELDVARRKTGILAGNVLIRRNAFDDVGGFDAGLRQAEDLDLIFKLAHRGAFVFVPETLVDYRMHANNATLRYRELCASIDAIIRKHQGRARVRNDRAMASAYGVGLVANQRYAWWSALRSARRKVAERHVVGALGDVAWAMRFAPRGPASALLRRVRNVR